MKIREMPLDDIDLLVKLRFDFYQNLGFIPIKDITK